MDRPGKIERARAHSRAHSRARQKLVELHRDEYQDILEAQKAAEGILKLQPRKVPA